MSKTDMFLTSSFTRNTSAGSTNLVAWDVDAITRPGLCREYPVSMCTMVRSLIYKKSLKWLRTIVSYNVYLHPPHHLSQRTTLISALNHCLSSSASLQHPCTMSSSIELTTNASSPSTKPVSACPFRRASKN